jgi:hypothetical protein
MVALLVIHVLLVVLGWLLFYDRAQQIYDRLALEDYPDHPQRIG